MVVCMWNIGIVLRESEYKTWWYGQVWFASCHEIRGLLGALSFISNQDTQTQNA